MRSLIARMTLISGSLDMGYAIVVSLLKGRTALGVMQGVASGPFGDAARTWGWSGGLLGLVVHFAIMSIMVTTFVLVVPRLSTLRRVHPLALGTLYGCVLYGVMYCLVLPLRWPQLFPQTDAVQIAIALFPHIAFVGVPVAYALRRAVERSLLR